MKVQPTCLFLLLHCRGLVREVGRISCSCLSPGHSCDVRLGTTVPRVLEAERGMTTAKQL